MTLEFNATLPAMHVRRWHYSQSAVNCLVSVDSPSRAVFRRLEFRHRAALRRDHVLRRRSARSGNIAVVVQLLNAPREGTVSMPTSAQVLGKFAAELQL